MGELDPGEKRDMQGYAAHVEGDFAKAGSDLKNIEP
jgi:hypothetical protein